MPDHTYDLPLAILVALLIIKDLVRYVLGRVNGVRGGTATGGLSINGASAIWAELNRLRDALEKVWEKLSELSERLARLEP